MAEANGAPGAGLTADQKYELISNNLQEVLNKEIIQEVLSKNERPLKIYWGTATTGKPHCGYFVPMLKIAEFLAAGCSVKVLLADVHGFLDNLKAPIELVKVRAQYYEHTITTALKAVGVDVSRLEFVLGSSYQTTGESGAKYFMDLLRLSCSVSGHDASKAGSEVVKQVEAPPLSSQIYPLMQALDEQYLDVDAQFGGVDQRKIFTLAVEALPRVGFAKRAHLMNPLIPGLQEGGKMSSSDPDSKIDLIDPPEIVKKKLKKAYCPPRTVEGNGVLSFVEYVLLPASALKNNGTPKFVVQRRDAEPLEYDNIKKMQEDYLADVLQPQSLKPAVTDALLEIMAPIQETFQNSKEWQDIEKAAYPPPPAPEKKAKKVKNLGSRFPGAKPAADGTGAIEAKPDGHVEGPDAEKASLATPEDAVTKLSVNDKA
ncbi:Tyrosine--tRNA ligase, cytoplasmic [Fulvia fulva]|uniref:Tyrosine--tRNA ligase n=1 Tax=Passalora fulva TaxID=5499 RepID=A0A9Q8UTD3_PASFU|nr:Tyrosine--tRNA ligase, cytoplasmic [Fulvia fulva]KAK4613787.1 Tyrosine--tRNA ligase, cytoplasmic [Fulvia fulva]KAK4615045.1 Tyrosine--tRNA ligase, cytoplasmic [Fulvia fulva]UJO21670.1 Tyrosine--tRNA ligase, cytoplasmic [Fulvia fulva]WPV20125.1 Tyrosine--tRNA ligase, cytoplasmic [Fulvia fulva]WPV35235.1 Tyrosine--tRNA ligase, cytoplasmic [Fulvia fulva]